MNLELLDLRRTALLVVDMQNAFCHKQGTLGISGVDTEHLSSVVAPLRALIQRCQGVGMPVLWTLQEHFPIDHRRGRKRLRSHPSRRKRVAAMLGTWDAALIAEPN
jgi:nicotinamidase-related amidase